MEPETTTPVIGEPLTAFDEAKHLKQLHDNRLELLLQGQGRGDLWLESVRLLRPTEARQVVDGVSTSLEREVIRLYRELPPLWLNWCELVPASCSKAVARVSVMPEEEVPDAVVTDSRGRAEVPYEIEMRGGQINFLAHLNDPMNGVQRAIRSTVEAAYTTLLLHALQALLIPGTSYDGQDTYTWDRGNHLDDGGINRANLEYAYQWLFKHRDPEEKWPEDLEQCRHEQERVVLVYHDKLDGQVRECLETLTHFNIKPVKVCGYLMGLALGSRTEVTRGGQMPWALTRPDAVSLAFVGGRTDPEILLQQSPANEAGGWTLPMPGRDYWSYRVRHCYGTVHSGPRRAVISTPRPPKVTEPVP